MHSSDPSSDSQGEHLAGRVISSRMEGSVNRVSLRRPWDVVALSSATAVYRALRLTAMSFLAPSQFATDSLGRNRRHREPKATREEV